MPYSYNNLQSSVLIILLTLVVPPTLYSFKTNESGLYQIPFKIAEINFSVRSLFYDCLRQAYETVSFGQRLVDYMK